MSVLSLQNQGNQNNANAQNGQNTNQTQGAGSEGASQGQGAGAQSAGNGNAQGSASTNASSEGSNGGSRVITWREHIPEEYKSEQSLLNVPDDVAALIKMTVHSQRMVGADKVALPSKHASEDDYQIFYDKLGRPTLDKYEIEKPKDSKFIDDDFLNVIKPEAHKLGIMPKQLSALVKKYEEHISKIDKETNEQKMGAIKQGLDGLKKEWGGAYPHKVGYAHNLLREHGSENLHKLLHENPEIGDNPELIKLLSAVGEKLYKEDNLPEGEVSSSRISPSEARDKATSIMSDSSHPYNMGDHPNHKAAVKEVQELMAIAYPENN